LGTPIDALEGFVSNRDVMWLKKNGIKTVEALASMDPVELCKLSGFKSASLVHCRDVVEEAKRYLCAFKRLEKVREMYKKLWSQMPSFTEAIGILLSLRPFILQQTQYFVNVTEKHAGVVGYCIRLRAYSLETDSLETLAERCYASEEEAEKQFEEAAEILKQKLGSLICVDGVDGDCLKQFEES